MAWLSTQYLMVKVGVSSVTSDSQPLSFSKPQTTSKAGFGCFSPWTASEYFLLINAACLMTKLFFEHFNYKIHTVKYTRQTCSPCLGSTSVAKSPSGI